MNKKTKMNITAAIIFAAVCIAVIVIVVLGNNRQNEQSYFDENKRIVELNSAQSQTRTIVLPTNTTNTANTANTVNTSIPANSIATVDAKVPQSTYFAEEKIPIETIEKKSTPMPAPAYTDKPEAAVFDQETTDKINEVNSYSMMIKTFDRQKFVDACVHIARGETFDIQSLDIFQDEKLRMHYISHTDNIVERDIGMSYWHDYINPSGALDGFKYTVAFKKGDKWVLHCITIRMA